jgi:hypothetical protein
VGQGLKQFKFILLSLILLPVQVYGKRLFKNAPIYTVYEIVDHLAAWNPDYNPTYTSALEQKLKMSAKDQAMISTFKKVRDSHFKREKGKKESSIWEDGSDLEVRWNNAVYMAKNLIDLKKRLIKVIPPDDAQLVYEVINHFKARLPFILQEEQAFSQKLVEFRKKWKSSKSPKLMRKLAKFLKSKKDKNKYKGSIIATWWPKELPPVVDLRPPHIIFRIHPLHPLSLWSTENLLMEYQWSVTQSLKMDHKVNLAKIFAGGCRGREIEFRQVWKLVWGKMMREKAANKKNFVLFQEWSDRHFTNLFAKTTFALIEEQERLKGNLTGDFMNKLTDQCYEIHTLSTQP